MSTNRNRALALASGLALVASGLVAAPAVAAAGDVILKPSSGVNYGSLATDPFTLSNEVSSLVSATTTAYKITTDEEILEFTLKQGTRESEGVTIYGFNSLGNQVDLDSIDDTTNTTSAKIATTNYIDTGGSIDNSDDNLGQPAVAAGVFEVDMTALAGIIIYQSSFDDTVVDGNSSGSLVETLSIRPMKTAGTAYAYGEGSPEPVTVQSWVESEASVDYTTVDGLYASEVRTLTWVDPKSVSVIPTIERLISGGNFFNDDNDTNAVLAHSLRFVSAGLNLDQLDLRNWDYDVVQADGSALSAGADLNNDYTTANKKIRAGLITHDAAGKIHVAPTLAAPLNHDDSYKVIVNHNADTSAAVDFGSVGFTLPTSTVDYHIEATVDTSDKLAVQTSHTDLSTEVLAGTFARTWTAQIKSDDDTVAETASVQVMAVVSYPSTYAPGTLTVSGSSETISTKGGYTMVNGFTDSKGKFKLTVTSSTAVKAENYTVDFFVVAEQTAKQLFVNLDDAGNGSNATHVATYKASDADGTSLAAANDVLSGASVTAAFTVTDNFGLPTSVDGSKAMQIELKATDTDDLKVYSAVAADGTVSFTFDNYLGTGESDILTATLFTGSQTDQTSVDTALITLYNASSVAAVQVPETISTSITYDDFLTDGAKATTAAPAPNDGAVELKGTIVDTNGAGVPGTAVTITGAGLQFVEDGGTKYYTDSITVNTSAAGVFDINVYSHIVNTTGVDITVTASGTTATSKLKTFLPATGGDGVNGNNLVFSLDMPANTVMNKTYAVTAKLTDKWGNPIKTNDSSGSVSGLSIIGTGSIQINSDNSATTKNFGADGTTIVFLRSVKDIAGPGAVVATVQAADYTGGSVTGSDQALSVTEIAVDVKTTAWDETVFKNEISTNVEVYETEADIPAAVSTGTKVNAGSFKGYVAVYAKGYEGKRLSAKIGNDWVIVPSLASSFERIVDFTGAGVDISVRIYIDRVLLDTIELTTK